MKRCPTGYRHILNIRLKSQESGKNYVLGLPTGSTPIGVYRNLVDNYREGELSFQNVTTFNMDEYVNLPKEHPQSYHHFMHKNLFDHIDIKKGNVNLLDGMASDLELECSKYGEKFKMQAELIYFWEELVQTDI